ncbi:skin secretory protein xP2 isoform X2 [Gallus gallus]|uniref:skin secretory protein xP2 isoform X2 n=1 Tax=Gallus gallus TaxID=9031 RepID=UPI001AEB8F93|nr:skin secretory protein xP2 isoform X2 [Gallus gallus]
MAAAVNAVKCHIRMRGSPASREGGAAPRPRREQQPPLPPPQEGSRGGAAAPGPAAASPQPPTPARSPARGALPSLLPSRAQRSFGPPRGRSSPGPLRTEARPGHLRPAARSGDAGLGRAASELGLAWKEAGEGCLCGKRQKSVNKAVPCPDTIVLQEPRAEDRVPTVAETDLRSCAEGEGKGAGEEVTPGRSRLRQSVKGDCAEGHRGGRH